MEREREKEKRRDGMSICFMPGTLRSVLNYLRV